MISKPTIVRDATAEFLDLRTRIQVSVEVLKHFDPQGQWQSDPVFQRWTDRQARYYLSLREYRILEGRLSDAAAITLTADR